MDERVAQSERENERNFQRCRLHRRRRRRHNAERLKAIGIEKQQQQQH